MHRKGVAFVQKIVPVSIIAILLLCAPLHLAAQERESPQAQASVFEWFASLWSDFAVWLAGEVIPDPKTTGTDGGGCLDPNGGWCGG